MSPKLRWILTDALLLTCLSISPMSLSQEVEEVGNWSWFEGTDEMTDKKFFWAELQDSEGVPDALDNWVAAWLRLGCAQGGGTWVSLRWPNPLRAAGLGTDKSTVMWRFDSGHVHQGSWSLRRDEHYAELSSGLTTEFLKNLAFSHKLVLRVSKFRTTQTAAFDVTQTATVLARLRKSCQEKVK
jgi:hypothetical protein